MQQKKLAVAIFFSLLSGVTYAQGNVKWGYEGNIGPAHWGELSKEFATCKTGQVQAPIDIPSNAASTASAPIATSYSASAGEIVNNGHTIQVNLPNAGSAKLGAADYKFLQFHLHTPAEEKIDGMGFPFNAHLVHQSADGKLAVIGIFFKEGGENAALKPIFAAMPSAEGKVSLAANFSLNALFPPSLAYYNYSGSLTTPGCNEGVSFFILKTPVEMSSAQLTQFKNIFPMNARPIMPLNGRTITESN